MKKSILFFVAGLLAGCAQPVVNLTVIDGVTRKPLAGVTVEYYGTPASILSRAIPHNRRIILGFTNSKGEIEINTYPNRQLAELWLIKPDYAPGQIQWMNDDESHASIGSPFEDDNENICPGQQNDIVNINDPLIVRLYPYRPGVVHAPLRMPGISPDGTDDTTAKSKG